MNAKELGEQSVHAINTANVTPNEDGTTTLSLDCVSAGLTKRELIAAMCLQGMLSSDMSTDRTKANFPKWATGAVAFADALLAELAKEQTP